MADNLKNNGFFPEIRGNFGFGCMRLPKKDNGELDHERFSLMADEFIAGGFNYFDTAHGYHRGKSETAIRECVVKRHKREEFLLTNKLSHPFFDSSEEIRPLFEKQLEACGVDYFDFYLMHAQDAGKYERYLNLKAYETVRDMKEEGLLRHFGISFHDRAEVLDRILSEQPDIEIVQIQLNYADWQDASVDSRRVYEVCVKHGKPMIIMEPVKGGKLVNLPPKADAVLRALGGGSNASFALRYAGSLDNVVMVLSGMSSEEQVRDNIKTMGDFRPLDEKEIEGIAEVCRIFSEENDIPCTSCRYCVDENECPAGILIPDLFSAYNSYGRFRSWSSQFYYDGVLTVGHGKASDCLGCGGCESVCPQRLPIRELLAKISGEFDKKKD